MITPTTQDLIEKIQGAPLSEPSHKLAERLDCSETTVKKYRRQAKEIRQEAARQAIAEDVERNLPGALDDLGKLREMSREEYELSRDPKTGQLWLGAIKLTLSHVTTEEDSEFAGWTDAELEHYANTGERPAGK